MKEMQIKAMRYCLTPVIMVIVKKIKDKKVFMRIWKENPCTLFV